jgi:hypothetical protein
VEFVACATWWPFFEPVKSLIQTFQKHLKKYHHIDNIVIYEFKFIEQNMLYFGHFKKNENLDFIGR